MRLPFQRLLVATEHTDFDSGAERVALAMAGRCGLPLAAVFPLVSNPEYEAVAPQLVARAEADAMAKIADLEHMADSAGVDLDVHVRRGDEPWQEVVADAGERGADLLIVRRRGRRSFIAQLMVGDLASKVAAHAHCNVLMVPRGGRMWQHSLVAAIDGTAACERVVAVAIGVAAQCGLPLIFVSVAAKDDVGIATTALTRAVNQATAAGVNARAEVAIGKVHEAVAAIVQRTEADLLIVGLRGDEAVEGFLLGSNARKLIARAETPVLVVKP